MSRAPVIIIGACLAGLAAARALVDKGNEFLVLEAGDRVGGLCRTEHVNGFSFDYSGHLLHLKGEKVRSIIRDDLGIELEEHVRRASVHVEGTYVPYPIQANFGRLSPATVKRCIEGYRRSSADPDTVEQSFPEWARGQFGDGLAEIFMIPYNRKLYVHPLEEMEPSWTDRFIPRPEAEAMERAARGEDTGTYGYNATFLYPSRGGIEILPKALAGGMEDRILLGRRVASVDTGRRTVEVQSGEKYAYGDLISTVPLPDLLRMVSDLPADLIAPAERLRCSAVTVLCLGCDLPTDREEHWIYFPEQRYPFYRVGVFSNFSPSMAPPGTSSYYVEIAHRPGEAPDEAALTDKATRALIDLGIVPNGGRTSAGLLLSIPCAYVFFDRFRQRNLASILAGLKERSIHSIGRYGAWEYSAMEDAIEWGLRTAEEIGP